MIQFELIFQRAIRDLAISGHEAAIVGGFAVSARTQVRFTRDVDLAVSVSSDRDTEELVRRLIISGYGVKAMLEHETTGRLATARLVAPGNYAVPVLVDLLFATSGIEPEIVALATEHEVWPGIRGKVARTGHWIALKILSRDMKRRPQDHIDLVNLINVADDDERALAFDAARLIETRGYARGRALVEDLRKLVAELSD